MLLSYGCVTSVSIRNGLPEATKKAYLPHVFNGGNFTPNKAMLWRLLAGPEPFFRLECFFNSFCFPNGLHTTTALSLNYV